MTISSTRFWLCLVVILLTSCSAQINIEGTPITPPVFTTSTLPASPIPHSSDTAFPSTATPTITQITGVTTTQLNVRTEPSTTGEVLGVISANSTVQIVGRDIGGNWWQIIYADGTGWITAQYVETGDSSGVPVIGGAETSGNTAIVIQQINIRSGPDTSFTSIGILNANDIVTLTGKNSSGTWLQIKFASDPSGEGWISSGFVKADDVTSLPIVSESGNLIGTGTPVNTPLPPTPTLVPAAMDFDSVDAPIKTINLEQGANTILYSGDVSSPNGDTEDWISVTTEQEVIYARIKCIGSDQIVVEIIERGINLVCNQTISAISTLPNIPFLIHIQANSSNQLQYTKYLLELRIIP